MKRDLIITGLGALAIAVIGTASYFAFLSDERRRAHLTAEAPAEIVEVFFARGRDPQTGSPDAVNHVRVSLRYTVSGREYSRVVTMNKVTGAKFKVGQTAKVCYSPETPDEAAALAFGGLHDYTRPILFLDRARIKGNVCGGGAGVNSESADAYTNHPSGGGTIISYHWRLSDVVRHPQFVGIGRACEQFPPDLAAPSES